MVAHALNNRRRRARQAGFTLVEVMVAVLLTAIATSGLIGLFMVETRSAGYSRHATEATIHAQDTLELLRTGTATGSATEYLDYLGNQIPLPHPPATYQFKREWQVVPGPSFDEVTVVVEWTEEGKDRNVTLWSKRNPP